ncbi:hypothetical protein [Streptomyces sp. NPDC088801]|uniref:hypothetical protein n=1 Tax=Streptomyces sp. NPDC088801 TaxID=3365903 RepID=UPI003800D989
MKSKKLSELWCSDWLEDGEPKCEADVVKAYDRWRVARADQRIAQGFERPGPLVDAPSYIEAMELRRALDRLEAA